jgi:hypothetical protein
MLKYLLTITGLLLLSGCQLGESKIEPYEKLATQDSTARARAEALCERLSEIKTMPFKREKVSDEVYSGLAELNEAAIPCLVEKLTDTTRMTDPRHEPTRSDFFTVGDAAFFTLIRLVDVPFEKVLPDEVMSKWKDEGLYAYFEYVQKDKNRTKLQAKWRTWYSERSKR